jgi:D-alanyl-D-alanine carboxypeptidase
MIVERLSGRPLSAELDRRLFRPLGMKDSYLPTRPPQGVKGPHGHGYATDASGALHDMDRLNASTLLGVGGVVSTAHDTAAFQRAYQEGRLLPPDLQKVFDNPAPGAPPAPDAGGVCQGKPSLTGHAGSAPGFVATTYTSPDGRIQFAVSMTVAGDGRQREAASRRVSEAVKTVFCPGT